MKKKIIDFSNVEKILKPIKRKGKKIVCCHGVFDLLHIGHLKHFESAKKYGEWYGYLHRDGRVSVRLKGNMWKGPYHLPRMLLNGWKWLEADLVS